MKKREQMSVRWKGKGTGGGDGEIAGGEGLEYDIYIYLLCWRS